MAEVSEEEMEVKVEEGEVRESGGIRERVEPCLQFTLSSFLKVFLQ